MPTLAKIPAIQRSSHVATFLFSHNVMSMYVAWLDRRKNRNSIGAGNHIYGVGTNKATQLASKIDCSNQTR